MTSGSNSVVNKRLNGFRSSGLCACRDTLYQVTAVEEDISLTLFVPVFCEFCTHQSWRMVTLLHCRGTERYQPLSIP
jgi:hypothetical protein